uniref:SPRY domain-containing protein 7 n=1 Tax=Cynoglossus semilaevis TaxID=244447 RepID=A0A3P8UZ30_CYNSE
MQLLDQKNHSPAAEEDAHCNAIMALVAVQTSPFPGEERLTVSVSHRNLIYPVFEPRTCPPMSELTHRHSHDHKRCCGDGGSGHIPLKEMPTVQLDTHHMGTDVVIVKSGRRICGTGGCLANAPLHQNKSYFEFKIQSTGVWGIGVATQKVNLNQVPMGRDTNSLVLRHDGSVYHNNEEKNRLPANSLPQEGDIVGITYDHVEMNLYLNGKNMHCPASGIRGTVYPVVYVDDSAILDCQFSDFYHTAPHGFEKILFEQQIF